MSVRHVWIWNVKGVWMENQGTVNSEKGAPIPPYRRNTDQQMDKCSVTLAKNMHVKLINSKCRACFVFIFHYD